MFHFIFNKKKYILAFIIQFIVLAAIGQVKYYAGDNMQSVISGTSTLHDWKMKSAKGKCNATFTLNTAEKLTGLSYLSFSIPSASLKSDSKGMDKNAYKALKSSQFPVITFNLTSATISEDGTLTCLGKLSIAGTTMETELSAVTSVNADKSIAVSGNKKISMKAFNMIPPTFMLGTIKTGNDIILSFDLTLQKL